MGLSTVSQNLNLLEEEGLIERNGYFEPPAEEKHMPSGLFLTLRFLSESVF